MYYPFDSRNKLYKSKFGAVASGESLKLRLILHNDARVHEAYLRVHKDGTDIVAEYPMPFSKSLDDYKVYECDLYFEAGLYFYSFRYTSDCDEFFVTAFENNIGGISNDGRWWQLTCYDKEFKTPDWLKGGVIYQIFPDRFCSSGKKKKDVPADRFIRSDKTARPEYKQNNGPCSLGNDYYCGDLAGITDKLAYLQSLGVTCIYLNPIFEAHSNHRYNTADYSKIDPLLGDERDLKILCKKASRLGISVILDGVFSHTGDDSIYFNKYGRYDSQGALNEDSPYRSWFKFDDSPIGYESWWGVPSLPEVHEEDEGFDRFITGERGIIRRWMKCGIRGWRLDVADELPDCFLDNIRKAIKSENPDALLLGEVWEDASNKVSYGERRRYLLGDQLDSVMNYPFAEAVISYIKGGDGFVFMDKIMSILENYPKQVVDVLMNHLGTHDTARLLTVLGHDGQPPRSRAEQADSRLSPSELAKGIKRLRLAAVLQYTLPGVPSLYYGDEAGAEGWGDPFCRGFYPWGREKDELIELYRFLGELRRRNEVFKDGEFIPVVGALGAVAFIRKKGDEELLIAVNRWREQDIIEIPEQFLNAEAIYGNEPDGFKLTVYEKDFAILKKKIPPFPLL